LSAVRVDPDTFVLRASPEIRPDDALEKIKCLVVYASRVLSLKAR